MDRQNIIAAKAARKSTLKSIRAKRESRIKSIQDKAAEEIRQINIQFAADPERMKAKYAADAAYKSERAKRRSAKAQKREESRVAYEMKQKQNERLSSFAEEIFNSITIGIGAGLSAAALVLYIVQAVYHAPDGMAGKTIVCYTLSGAFLFLLYLMSTLAHALGSFAARRVFRILSYGFGFLTVSSVLSLFALICIRGTAGWILFSLSSFLGIFAVAFYSGMERHPAGRKIGIKIYVFLFAALLIFELVLLCPKVSVITLKFLVLASVSFAVAELFHAMKNVRWTNSIFHLLSIIANIFGFFAIYYAIL